MFTALINTYNQNKTQRLQRTISRDLSTFAGREEYTLEQVSLFKQVQILLQNKAYEDASRLLTQLVATT